MVARSATMPTHAVHVASRPVLATVTARPAIACRCVNTTRWRCRRLLRSGAGLTVGLGVQWTPPFHGAPPDGSAEPRPGTLQLCTRRRCLVFQLARAGRVVVAALRRFLADARVTFAGYNVASDCRKLRAHHHGVGVASTLELRAGAGNAARLLGIRGVKKAKKVGTSRWDRATLSKKQLRYACVDAYLSCCLGVHLRRAMASQASDSDSDSDSD